MKIVTRCGEGELQIGTSHWWGYPDMPAGMPLPTMPDWDGCEDEIEAELPMSFICQINLADLPEDCTDLPHDGLLLFFADIDYYLGLSDEPAISMHVCDAEDVRVIYVPKAEMSYLERRLDAFPDFEPFDAQPISLGNEPHALEEPEHQLLGSSGHLEWEDWPEPCEGWRLLMQMDSMETPDGEINFVDWGVLCFIIEPEALKRLDFSNVRAIILST